MRIPKLENPCIFHICTYVSMHKVRKCLGGQIWHILLYFLEIYTHPTKFILIYKNVHMYITAPLPRNVNAMCTLLIIVSRTGTWLRKWRNFCMTKLTLAVKTLQSIARLAHFFYAGVQNECKSWRLPARQKIYELIMMNYLKRTMPCYALL